MKSPQIFGRFLIEINQFLIVIVQIQIRVEIIHIVLRIPVKFIKIVNQKIRIQ